ncbi:glycosyltransferase family 4 protein [Aestuariivivens sediminis]|uniref:glycosyltransferase family 4 protein n=1 Tax=Aestuariivivens sediminis TaxID=2913557 RepID=UPI001F5A28EC|nr:glycosyltransferase family 4 protein [Aestuariivivens sediminis]
MTRSKRILIVSSEFPPQPGGIGNHAYNLARALKESNFEVTVLVDARSNSGKIERDFDSGLPFAVKRIAVSRVRFIMYIKRLLYFNTLKKGQDYILASGKFSLWLVGFGNVFGKTPCLAVIHGTEVNFKSPLLKWSVARALKRFDGVVAVSNYTKHLVDPLKLKQVKVIPNGYDAQIWTPKSNEAAPLLEGRPKLITVGRLSPRKGQTRVIGHLPRLVKVFPEVHYHCVGIDTEKDACLELAQCLGVQDHLHIHGEVSQDALIKHVAQSDIMVMLSTASPTGDVEGFGIAILEANALGIPAIGARGSGVEDAIQDGLSGLLIDGTDADALADAVATIMNHKTEFKKQALLWAEQHQWRHIIRQYIAVLEGMG